MEVGAWPVIGRSFVAGLSWSLGQTAANLALHSFFAWSLTSWAAAQYCIGAGAFRGGLACWDTAAG